MNVVVETINGAGGAFIDFSLPMLVQSSVLVVILLLIDDVLRKRVRAVFRYWIWMLVLVKLVLPVSLWSPVSIGRWFGDLLTVPTTALYEAGEPRPPVQVVEARSITENVLSQDVPVSPKTSNSPVEGLYPEAVYTQKRMQPRRASAEMGSESLPGSAAIPYTPTPALSLSWQGLVLLSWAVVAIALLLLLLQRSFFVRGLVAQADEADAAMVNSLNQCRRRMGMRREVVLKLSAIAGSPAACGLIHPVILIPQHLAPRFQPHDLQAVLLHELAHIKRGDLWINLAQTLLQIVYFYNPLLWLANAIIRRTREQAVDETVLVAMGEAAQQYPEILVSIAKLAFRKRPGLSLRLIGVVESKSALSARIRHILSRPIPKSAKLGLLGLLAVSIIAVVLLPMAEMLEPRATVVNDGPLDIRFLGVCPDQSGDTLSGDGEKIESIAYQRTGQPTWRPHTLRRDFLFEAPEVNEPVLFSYQQLITMAGGRISSIGPIRPVTIQGRRVVALDAHLPQFIRKPLLVFFPRKIMVRRVDVALKYFYGPPRETLVSFQGPFTQGQVLTDARKPGTTLTVLPERADGPWGDRRAYFRLNLPFQMDVGTPVVIYDAEGKRHVAFASSTSMGRGTTTVEFYDHQEYTSLARIARVAVERPYAFTVRNVRVSYPDRPPRDHAAYLDVMAQRLNLTGQSPERVAQYQFASSKEAIQVIDVVEGQHIQTVLQALQYRSPRFKVSDLDPATQETIHRAAARWIESGYTSEGICLGLLGQWPEFTDMALKHLAGPRPAGEDSYQEYMWVNQNRSIVSTLQRSQVKLSASQVEQFKQVILNTGDGSTLDMLLIYLGGMDAPESIGALWDLAQDDRPWIWWRAVEMWQSRTAQTRRGYGDLPGKMKLRLFLVSGIPVDENLTAGAPALLPQMFTPELARMSPDAWRKVNQKIAEGSDRKTATEAYLSYLRGMQSVITERPWPYEDGSRYILTSTVATLIRTLNVWYGTDLGKLGTDERMDSSGTGPRTLSEFQDLIAQALQWHEDHRDTPPVEQVFQGKVVDKAGNPIARAQLSLTGMENYRDQEGNYRQRDVDAGQWRTDASGNFTFSKLGNMHHMLRVEAPGYVTREHVNVDRLPDGRFRLSGEATDNVIVLQKPAASLSGRVIGADGRPLAGARVQLVIQPADHYFHPDAARTDAGGRFTVPSLISGSYLVSCYEAARRAERGDYESVNAFQPVTLEEGQAIKDLVLDLRSSTCSLEFEIVDRNGQPLAAEIVTLEVPLDPQNRSQARIVSGFGIPARPIHRLDHLPPVDGSLTVFVRGQGPSKTDVQLRPNQTVHHKVKFEDSLAQVNASSIPATGSDQPGSGKAVQGISGVVVDPNGRAIADVWATVENKDLLLEPKPTKLGSRVRLVVREDTVHSDSTGRFVLTGLQPGVTDIRVWADGHRTELVQAVPSGTTDLRVVLGEPQSYTVSGVVIDSQGTPLGETSVTLVSELFTAQDAGRTIPPVTIRTDATGAFRFSETFQPGDARSVDRTLIARKPGYGLSGTRVDGTGGVTSVRITLGPEEKVSGTVVNEAGEPIAGAEVALRSAWWKRAGLSIPLRHSKLGAQTVTTSDGSFTLEQLPTESDLFLRISAEGYAGDELRNIYTGKYGSYGVRRDSGADFMGMNDRDPNAPLKIVLKRGVTLRGTVVYEDAGKPAQYLRVGTQEHRGAAWSQALTDQAGRFELKNVSPTPCNLLVMVDEPNVYTVPDWTAAAITFRDLQPGQMRDGLSLILTKGGLVRGKATDSQGHPLKGIDIGFYSAARPESGAECQYILTHPDGTWMYRFPPGEVTIYIRTKLSDGAWQRERYQYALGTGQVIDGVDFTLDQAVPADSRYRKGTVATTGQMGPFLKPYEADGLKFEAGFIPDKAEYVWGEPMHYFTYVIRNTGDKPLSFVEGGDYRGGRSESHRLTAVDANGLPVPAPEMPEMGGIIDIRKLRPGEVYTKSLPVERRLTFRGPGVYQVTGHRTLRLATTLEERQPLEVPTENSFQLTIHPYSPQRMAQLAADVAAEIAGYGNLAPKDIEFTEPEGLTPANHLHLALETLVSIRESQALDELIRLARQGPEKLRIAAVQYLGRRTEPQAMTAILDALNDPQVALRAAAADALGTLRTEQAVDILIDRFGQGEPDMAPALLKAMGRTRSPKVLALLVQSLAHGDGAARYAAADGLVAFGSEQAIEALKTCVTDPDMDFRETVVRHLAESLKQPIDARWLVPVVQSRKGAQTIGDAPRLMRLYGGERAVPALLSCLDFENPSIRNYYNCTIIDQQGAFQSGLRIPWICDLNRDGSAEELEHNRQVLLAIQTWVGHYYAHRMDEVQIPQSQYWQEQDKYWGEPVDGIDIRIRCDQRVWPEGMPQVIQIDVRDAENEGSINLTKPPEALQVELNGRLYERRPPLTEPTTGVNEGQGRSFHNLVLDDHWQSITAGRPIELAPGVYTLTVRLSTVPETRRTGLAASRPIRFEIIAVEPTRAAL